MNDPSPATHVGAQASSQSEYPAVSRGTGGDHGPSSALDFSDRQRDDSTPQPPPVVQEGAAPAEGRENPQASSLQAAFWNTAYFPERQWVGPGQNLSPRDEVMTRFVPQNQRVRRSEREQQRRRQAAGAVPAVDAAVRGASGTFDSGGETASVSTFDNGEILNGDGNSSNSSNGVVHEEDSTRMTHDVAPRPPETNNPSARGPPPTIEIDDQDSPGWTAIDHAAQPGESSSSAPGAPPPRQRPQRRNNVAQRRCPPACLEQTCSGCCPRLRYCVLRGCCPSLLPARVRGVSFWDLSLADIVPDAVYNNVGEFLQVGGMRVCRIVVSCARMPGSFCR